VTLAGVIGTRSRGTAAVPPAEYRLIAMYALEAGPDAAPG
jgi:hypothetical protein